jgi:oligopeptide transport system ATP-binding protein
VTRPLLEVSGLRVHFPVRGGGLRGVRPLRALDGVDLHIAAGEAVGVVGESGCGKSTLARAVLQLVRPTAGRVVWLGQTLNELSTRELRPLRRDLQIVFQDPLASLDPRMTIGEIVGEPLRVHRRDLDAGGRRVEVAAMLERVGLGGAILHRYPHEFSGGQCQRIGIARAMILRPKLLVCDEPVSALDVSIQAQIINLLTDLKREYGMAILFVSHNIAVVRRLCDRVLVLYLGRMMELAPAAQLHAEPLHPYTRTLLAAVPVADPDAQRARLEAAVPVAGELPSPLAPPSGCVFRTRCPHAVERCRLDVPSWDAPDFSRRVACHRWQELIYSPAPTS